MTWTRLRVDYYDGAMDDLILDAIRPAWHEIRGYFLCHWVRGPHLRIFVDGDATEIRAVERHLAAVRRHHRPARAAPLHERLAELEGERGPLLPWAPHNTIADEPPGLDTELDRFLADFYADTTEAAFDALDRVRAGAPLPGIAFDLVVATAHDLSESGLPAARTSLRSRAEAYLSRLPGGVRAQWQAHYERNREPLTTRIKALTGAGEITAWLRTIRATHDRGRTLIDEGRLSHGPAIDGPAIDGPAIDGPAIDGPAIDGPAIDGPATDRRATQPPLAEVSPFQRRLETDERWLALKDTPAFAAYRLALNCAYLHLTRFGLAPDQRFLICHLAASAADDVYRAAAS
ncbi:lantibiotic dehydratase C-terminal domain-containing protein [Nonomuraea angiospora]|uniref:lantibiotic dehydratase C-terminal domain-containing protein n=1 Tax=Nonomuraea angiospora TaxID=46172 RepID=UPI0033D9113C